MNLHRYWLDFVPPSGEKWPIQCGVTAESYADALSILQATVFEGSHLPVVKHFIEDVDISTLDRNHIKTEPPNWRGVWYPMGSAKRH